MMQYLWAFLIGGAICTIGQLLLSLTKLTPPRILVLFVTLGVLLGAIGVYEPLVRFAGAGATVPLTGFGYTLAKGAIEAVRSDGLIGAFTGSLKAAAGGIAAAILFGYLGALFGKPKTKY
ncbi:MAG: stage V sporulation protein AE [Clostridia bacterium]|jgi:stage V sporulation protein AE|nr:stage V sporulation protein AE [Clostridia bacterium]